MECIYINRNGHYKSLQGEFSEPNNHYDFHIQEQNFVIALLEKGALHSSEVLFQLEQYFALNGNVKHRLIQAKDFSHAGRVFVVKIEDLVNPQCCGENSNPKGVAFNASTTVHGECANPTPVFDKVYYHDGQNALPTYGDTIMDENSNPIDTSNDQYVPFIENSLPMRTNANGVLQVVSCE